MSNVTSTVTSIDDDTLQRLYDGDLTPLEEHGVLSRIERDPDAQRRLAELGQLTELFRSGAEELGAQVNSSALFDDIESRLAEADETKLGTRLRVMSSEWFEHRRSALVPIVAATAVAAVTLFAVVGPGDPAMELSEPSARTIAPGAPQTERERERQELDETPFVAPTAAVEGNGVHGSQVEDVDFGSSTGTVFEIDNQGVAVAVVWISDEEGP